MKKRRKDDDDSCLVQFVKTILLLACVYWGLITAMRTVDDSWWLIGGIAVVSYLLLPDKTRKLNLYSRARMCVR